MSDTHTLCCGGEGYSETGCDAQRGSYGAQQPCWAFLGLAGVYTHAPPPHPPYTDDHAATLLATQHTALPANCDALHKKV